MSLREVGPFRPLACSLARMVLGLALGLGLIAAAPASLQAQDAAQLSPDGLRDLAFRLLQQDQPAQALDLAAGLIARDPGDAGAWIIRSRALRALGQLPQAESAAREAFRVADTAALKYGAALSLAQALSLQGQRTWSQVWLRRATHYATTDDQRARVARDYAFVRSQNPLGLRFDFSLQPSNNVNNGSMRSVWDLFGLPLVLSGDAQALSGVVADMGLSGSYRLGQTATTLDALTFGLDDREIVLSPGARAQAPTADNGDFRLTSVEGGYQHRQVLAPDGTILTSELSLGHDWYGGAALSHRGELSVDLTHPFAPGRTGFAHLSLGRTLRLDAPVSTANAVSLSGGWSQRLGSGDTLRLTLGLTRTLSDDIAVDNMASLLALDWTRADLVAGLRLGAGAAVEWTEYAASPFSFDGRQDLSLSTGITAEVTQVSVYGFSPVLSLTYAANLSNIGLYDTRSLGLGLSFRSRF